MTINSNLKKKHHREDINAIVVSQRCPNLKDPQRGFVGRSSYRSIKYYFPKSVGFTIPYFETRIISFLSFSRVISNKSNSNRFHPGDKGAFLSIDV